MQTVAPEATGRCRFSGIQLRHTFVDLGMSPLANSYLRADQCNRAEPFYPLHTYVSEDHLLVQLEQFETPQAIFGDYAYFSSFSESWLRHAENYVTMAIDRFGLGSGSFVTEVASNDGYLLQYFRARGVPVLGVEPAANVAVAAVERGIPTEVAFFGEETAADLCRRYRKADLLVGNNVLAHVPDLNDFVRGIEVMLAPRGVLTMEFPHLLQLMAHNQFDTIYHEHFSYFSLRAVAAVFARHGITLFDVEELSTHGGSIRIFGKHAADDTHPVSPRIHEVLDAERAAGLDRLETYLVFGERVKATKRNILSFLVGIKNDGRTIAGYGAPAKGNTLLNYCGIGTDFLDYTVDRSPHKQGLFLPGTHVPILVPEALADTKPDYVLILPWNLADEISEQMSEIRRWGGQFITLIPEPRVF